MLFGLAVLLFLLEFSLDSSATRLWVKHGCVKAGGTSVCGITGPQTGIGRTNYLLMRMEATFEVGFPPYLTPAHTYPTCVQKLTWPMLWEDIYFDLEKKCISSEQGEIPSDTYTACCEKGYSKEEMLMSPYAIKGVGENNPDGRVRDPDHESLQSGETSFEIPNESSDSSDSPATEITSLEYSAGNLLGEEETAFLAVTPKVIIEENVGVTFRPAEDLGQSDSIAKDDHLAMRVKPQSIRDEPEYAEGLDETILPRRRIRRH